MKLGSGRLLLAGALAAATLAAYAHLSYLNSLRETKRVVVTTREIAPFQKLDDSVLTLREVPAAGAAPDAITSLEEARGRFARGLLVVGEPVRASHLVDASGGALAARLTATGDPRARAMAVRVSADTGVANTLQPGDLVDLLVAVHVERPTGSVSKIIAQGVPVLFTSFDANEALGGTNREGTVVLQVVPQVAEELAFAQTSGRIWLLTTPYIAQPEETPGFDMAAFQVKYPVVAPTEQAR